MSAFADLSLDKTRGSDTLPLGSDRPIENDEMHGTIPSALARGYTRPIAQGCRRGTSGLKGLIDRASKGFQHHVA
jgi:hypothetical protein